MEIVTLLITLMGAPDATDMSVETQAHRINLYTTLEACKADLVVLQSQNPVQHFWCE